MMKLVNQINRFMIAVVLAAVMIFMYGAQYTAFAVEASRPTDLTVKQSIGVNSFAEKNPDYSDVVKYDMTAVDSETTKAAETPMPGGKLGGTYKFSIKGKDGEVHFPVLTGGEKGLNYKHAGVYAYKIQADPGNNTPSFIYDATTYIVKVDVINSGDGLAVKQIVANNDKGEKPKVVSFRHDAYWIPEPARTIFPDVVKKISGKPKKAETFTFSVKALESSNEDLKKLPVPEDKTTSVEGAGSCSFGHISFTEPGSYTYEVKEIAGTNKNYTYDKSVYTVTYNVYLQGKTLKTDVSIQKGGKSIRGDVMKFTNKYKGGKNGTKPFPPTGDTSMFMLWGGLLAAAVILLIVVVFRRRRREQ